MIINVIANWSNILFMILSVIVLYPFFIDVLGEEQYGIWLLLSSMTGYFSLLQMGVPMANVRFLSKYLAKKDYLKLNEVFNTNLLFFTVCGLLTFSSGFVLAQMVDVFFKIPSTFLSLAKISTVLICLEISLRFFFEAFEGFFHARQKFVSFNVIKNIFVILRVIATLLFLQNEYGLFWLAIIVLVITFLQGIVFCLYTYINCPYLKISYKYIKVDSFREIFNYSVFVLLLQVGSKISFNTDALVLGSMVSVSSVVYFNIGNNLLMYLMRFTSGISSALMPKISALESTDLSDEISSIYTRYSRIVMFIIFPICLSFFFFGGDFISLWLGESYRYVSGSILSLLSVGYLFYLVQFSVALPILMGTSRVKTPTVLVFVFSLVNLVMSVLLAKYYGIYGVALGTTIPLLVLSCFIVIYMCNTYDISIIRYFFKGMIAPMFGAISFLCIPFSIYFLGYRVVSYNSLIILSCFSFLLYYMFSYFFVFSAFEKSLLCRIFFRMK